jgi:hypothetical protein
MPDTRIMGGEDEAAALVPAVRTRLDAGISPAEIARWLYADQASGRPMLAIKALCGAGIALGEAKQLVVDVIAEDDRDYFDSWVVATRDAEADALSQHEGAATSDRPPRRFSSLLARLRAGRSGARG